MGYSTRYKFTKIDGPDASAFRATLDSIAGFDTVYFNDVAKWYEHEAHVAKAMKLTAMSAVDLHGEGEKQGDVWDKEFRLVDGAVTVKTFKYRLVREEEPVRYFIGPGTPVDPRY